MTDKQLISKTADLVKKKFENESSGHDWWHLYRVWQLSKRIASKEKGANLVVVELGALLHDIADFKFHSNDLTAGPKAARKLLTKLSAQSSIIDAVCHIVVNVSFKGAGEANQMQSLEGKIVQDADRLDAIGAIGVGRAFAYGGSLGRSMYNPDIKPRLHETFKKYAGSQSPTINHFHEKLLLLKDRMNTETGKRMADRRHKFMEIYLNEFYSEWEGKL